MTDLLDLPDWQYMSIEKSSKLDTIHAQYVKHPDVCVKCESSQIYKHGPKVTVFRDVPFRMKATVIKAQLTRYRCKGCGGVFVQPVTASGFVLDGSAYFAGREDIKISIYDPFNDFWYTINIFGSGTANNVLIDVEKRAAQGRIVVNAT